MTHGRDRGGGPDRRRHRERVPRAGALPSPSRAAASGCACAITRRSRRSCASLFARLSRAPACRPGADGGAGVLLQRDLLHLCAGPDRFYASRPAASAGTSCRLPLAMSSGPCCSAGSSTPRPPADDRATYGASGVLLAATAYLFSGICCRRDADRGLDGRLLLRLGGGKLRLSDSQRELSARDSRARDRVLLRHRHGIGGVAGPLSSAR